MEISIRHIGGRIVNNYLLDTPLGVIAIDTGYPGGMERFRARFEKYWPLSRLIYLFLTHHHDDHAGFLAELLDQCGCQVVAHPLALEPLEEGRSREPAGAGYSCRAGALFGRLKKSFAFPPVHLGRRAIWVGDEEHQIFQKVGLPIQILMLPGHTADSIGLFLPETGQLFCGDAAMNAGINAARHTIWIKNPVDYGRSWDRMLALEPKRIYPSHGLPFPPDDLVKYRHYLDGRELIRL